MLLQNLQLVVGKRYESEEERKRRNRPILSVVLDEFAPFGYRNFAQILQTARGTNTAFLFRCRACRSSFRSARAKDDVTSAPNTKIAMRTQDEETSRFFIRASAEHTVTKRTVSLVREQMFGWERFERGTSGSEREEREYRAEDERIKNLPKGQMQILMTDDTEGTLHRHLHVPCLQTSNCGGLKWSWRHDCASRDWRSRERISGSKTRSLRLHWAANAWKEVGNATESQMHLDAVR